MTPAPDSSSRTAAAHEAISPEIEAAAAEWLARRDAGATPEQQTLFYQWLAERPEHAVAWRELESMWLAFDGPFRRGQSRTLIRELAGRRRRRRWRNSVGVAAMVVMTSAAAWVWIFPGPARSGALAPVVANAGAAHVIKPERRTLPDGSVVELNQSSQIETVFTSTRREVRLRRGEAHFVVTKDPARPFVVSADAAEVRAVGTEFAVRRDSQAVDVLVTEGSVAVGPRILLNARNRVRIPLGRPSVQPPVVETLATAEIDRLLAWRMPRLELSNAPLGDVVSLFNRESRVMLSVAEPDLARLRLSGVFRADNADGFVQLLESHYGIRAERRGELEVVLRRGQ